MENNFYHSTERLLREYRDVVRGLGLASQQIRNSFQLEYGESIEEFLDNVYLVSADLGGTEIESHAWMVERTWKMIGLVDGAVELLHRKHKNGEFFTGFSTILICPRRNWIPWTTYSRR